MTSGWSFVGFNVSNTATSGTAANTNMSLTVAAATTTATAYQICKSSAAYTATPQKNISAATGSPSALSCYRYNGASSCTVKAWAANVYTYSNWGIIGWKKTNNTTTTTSTATSGDANPEANLTLTANTNVVAIWRKSVTVTFNKNNCSSSNPTATGYAYNGGTSVTVKTPAAPTMTSGWSFVGFNVSNTATSGTAANTNMSLTVAAANTTATAYQVCKSSAAYTATIYYNSNSTSGSFTASNNSASCYRYNGASSCTATISSTTLKNSVGKYNTPYHGLANNVNRMVADIGKTTTTISLSANATYYAIYGGGETSGGTGYVNSNVTEYYYYGTTSTHRTLYRNEVFTSSTAMKTVLSNSATGVSNITTLSGPGGSDWVGYDTSAGVNKVHTTVAKAAESASLNLYAVYQFSVSFQKGTHISTIGGTSGSCLMEYNKTSCVVSALTISPATGYVENGWSTTKDATSYGVAPGSTITLSTNNQTYYANAKRSFTCGTVGSTTSYKGKNWYTVSNNGTTCELLLNDTVGSGTYSTATGANNPTYSTIKSYSDSGGTLESEMNNNLITSIDTIPNVDDTGKGLNDKWYWSSSGQIFGLERTEYSLKAPIVASYGYTNKLKEASGKVGQPIINGVNTINVDTGLSSWDNTKDKYEYGNSYDSALKTYGYDNKWSTMWSVWSAIDGAGTASKVRLHLETGSFSSGELDADVTRTATTWIKAVVCGGQHYNKVVTFTPKSSTHFHYNFTGTNNSDDYQYTNYNSGSTIYIDNPVQQTGTYQGFTYTSYSPIWHHWRNFTFAGATTANPYTDAKKQYNYNTAANCTTFNEYTVNKVEIDIGYRPHIKVKIS